ncbi:MAG TPA: patatin-like phospholipase family protein [Kofleriaceae bacterium]|nr:patatin-like phospholipase family protein [Kofleriaceae bacterium]
MPRVLFLAQDASVPDLAVERTTDFRHAVDRTREAYFDAMLIEVGTGVKGGPLALLDQFLDLRHRDLDRERRFRRDRILAVLPEMDNHAQDAILFELGRRRIGGWVILGSRAGAPDATAINTRIHALVRPPQSKKALCAAGGGITGVYYELGVLRCLEDAFRGFSVHDFDMYFGISAGAIVSSLVANRVELDRCLREIDPENLEGVDLELGLGNLNWRDIPARLWAVGRHLRDYRARLNRHEERLSVTGALSQLAAMFGPFFSVEDKGRRLADIFAEPGRTDDFRRLGKELYVGATDQDRREHVLFGEPGVDHVPIHRAVLASAAIHPFLTSVSIDGRRYTDGFVTRTTNIVTAVERGANLVVLIDPFLPLISDEPGFNHRHSLLWVLVQDYKTVAFTRYEHAAAAVHALHPAVTMVSFLPSNRMRRLLATNPISTANFDPIVTQAYASTYRRLERMAYRFGPALAEHGIELTLETAARKVQLIDASPAPRAELLCAGPLAARASVAARAA